MVKIAKKSAQDPTDSSLQMKVPNASFRLGSISSLEEETPQTPSLTPLFSHWEYSPRTPSLPSPSSGTTWEDNKNSRVPKDKFLEFTRYINNHSDLREKQQISQNLRNRLEVSVQNWQPQYVQGVQRCQSQRSCFPTVHGDEWKPQSQSRHHPHHQNFSFDWEEPDQKTKDFVVQRQQA